MPSATPIAPYIYPRVKADASGLEWVSVSEILDDLAGVNPRADQRYLIDTTSIATGRIASAAGSIVLKGEAAQALTGSLAVQGSGAVAITGSSVVGLGGNAAAGGSVSVGLLQFQTLAQAIGSASVGATLVATAQGSLHLLGAGAGVAGAAGSVAVLGQVVAAAGGSVALRLNGATVSAAGSLALQAMVATSAAGSIAVKGSAAQTAAGSIAVKAAGLLAASAGSVRVDAAADTTAPVVGTLTVTGGTNGGTFAVGATDSGSSQTFAWELWEHSSDPGASYPPSIGAMVASGTQTGTSLSLSGQAFTSNASATGTRYFRAFVKDAALNRGASAVASATVTVLASPIRSMSALATSNATLALPPTYAAGDILIAVVSGNSLGVSVANGWMKLGGNPRVLWKRAAGSSGETKPTYNNLRIGRIFAVSGVTAGSAVTTTPFTAAVGDLFQVQSAGTLWCCTTAGTFTGTSNILTPGTDVQPAGGNTSRWSYVGEYVSTQPLDSTVYTNIPGALPSMTTRSANTIALLIEAIDADGADGDASSTVGGTASGPATNKLFADEAGNSSNGTTVIAVYWGNVASAGATGAAWTSDSVDSTSGIEGVTILAALKAP